MEQQRRHSKKRDAILAFLRGTTTHPSAECIYSQLKPTFPDLSLGTVYRNLSQFRADSDIVSVGVVNGLARFDGNTAPHAHFFCTNCDAVLDVDELPLSDELLRLVSASCGEVTSCALTFQGLCKDCQNKKI